MIIIGRVFTAFSSLRQLQDPLVNQEFIIYDDCANGLTYVSKNHIHRVGYWDLNLESPNNEPMY